MAGIKRQIESYILEIVIIRAAIYIFFSLDAK